MTALGCRRVRQKASKSDSQLGLFSSFVVSTRQRKAELSPEICSFNRKLNEPLWFFYPPFRPPIGSQCEKNAKRRGGRAMSMSGRENEMKEIGKFLFVMTSRKCHQIWFLYCLFFSIHFPTGSENWEMEEKIPFLILSSPRNILDPRSFPSYLAASAENGEKKTEAPSSQRLLKD